VALPSSEKSNGPYPEIPLSNFHLNFSRLMTASLVLMAAALSYCKKPIIFLLDLVFSPWSVILDV
jgi:hypothetical protein